MTNLASYLTSYQFIQGQRVAVSNHLESITDPVLKKMLRLNLTERQLEEQLLSDMECSSRKTPSLARDYQRLRHLWYWRQIGL